MKQIAIHGRGGVVGHALVDDEDFDRLNAFRWYLDKDGYARATINRASGRAHFRMHRLVLGLEKGDPRVGDHRYGNRLDNRRENLRAVTLLQNNQRRGPRVAGTSRFRGVHRLKSTGKWQASVRYRDRLMHLGTWDTEEEAAEIAAAVRGALMPYSQEADAA